jgi:UDP-N-acetylmuramoylalanine--D-glutamate ligase
MTGSPDVAVITNITPNHLDLHRDMDEYVTAKRNIFERQSASSRLVLNIDDDITRGFETDAHGETVFFGRKRKPDRGVWFDNGVVYWVEDGQMEIILYTSELRVPGIHNVENFMAAIAAARELVAPEAVRSVAREFREVEHRIELVRELHGVRYYNDSTASSPTRTIAGLKSFDRKVILIAGGKDKGVAFDELGPVIVERVKTLVLTGLTAERIRDAVLRCNDSGLPEIIVEPDFERAVTTAHEIASDGDVVILSPASTSFDRFKNFEERGNFFRDIVSRLE